MIRGLDSLSADDALRQAIGPKADGNASWQRPISKLSGPAEHRASEGPATEARIKFSCTAVTGICHESQFWTAHRALVGVARSPYGALRRQWRSRTEATSHRNGAGRGGHARRARASPKERRRRGVGQTHSRPHAVQEADGREPGHRFSQARAGQRFPSAQRIPVPRQGREQGTASRELKTAFETELGEARALRARQRRPDRTCCCSSAPSSMSCRTFRPTSTRRDSAAAAST